MNDIIKFMVRLRGNPHGKPDENQTEVKKCLENYGCYVVITSGVPKFVDLIVGYGHQTFLVEVKGMEGKLSPSQWEFIGKWNKKGSPVIVGRTGDEIMSKIRKELEN